MKEGDRVVTIINTPWSEKGIVGKIIHITNKGEGVVIETKRGINWVESNNIELVTFKTYLCLLNKDQPLKNLIKDTIQTLPER